MKDGLRNKEQRRKYSISYFSLTVIMVVSMIVLSSCSGNKVSDIAGSGISEEYFQESVGSESVIYYFEDDFDGDGTEEAFGITGQEFDSGNDTELYEDVRIYFIHADGEIELLMEDTYGCLTGEGLIETDSSKFMVWELYWGGSGSISYIFGVIDGEAYEPDISGQYSWFEAVDGEDGIYHATTSEFGDEGHEWIDHYFVFDDESGQFTEKEFYLEFSTESLEFSESGESKTIVTNTNIDNDIYSDIAWTSDDESVATVDDTGCVTAVGSGETTIYATWGDLEAGCKVICDFSQVAVSVECEETTYDNEAEGTVWGYLTITGKNEDGETCWTVQTEEYELIGDGYPYLEIGINSDRYFYYDNGNIKCLNVGDGSARWETSISVMDITGFTFGNDGTLYIGGSYCDTGLIAISEEGDILAEVAVLRNYTDYPYNLKYEDGAVKMMVEHWASDYYTYYVTVDTDDYSMTVYEMDEDVIENICDLIVEHYTELWKPAGTYTSSDYDFSEDQEQLIFALRYAMSEEEAAERTAQGKTVAANTLIMYIYIDKETGKVTDDNDTDAWYVELPWM